MKIKKTNPLKNYFVALALLAGCDIQYTNQNPSNNNEETEIVEESIAQEGQETQERAHFRFPNERETIRYHAKRVGVDEELMLSIREAENGRQGRQFGIMPNSRYNNDSGYTDNGRFQEYPNDGELSKQASWAAWTIKRNKERFDSLKDRERARYSDFIDYLGEKYAPQNAENDPQGLNQNWKRNVRNRYKMHSR